MNQDAAVQALDVDNRDRFIMIYDDVWQALKGKTALSVYMALKRRVNPDRKYWYGTCDSLSEEAGVSSKTFRRCIDELEKIGLVVSKRRFVPKRWDGKDNSKVIYGGMPRKGYQEIGKLFQIRFHMPSGKSDQGGVGESDQTPLGKSDQTPLGKSDRQTYIPSNIDTLDIETPPTPQGGESEASQEVELAQPRANTVSKKGTRITPDWMPSQPVIEKMQAQFPDMDFFAVHEEFIDYWLGVPGQRGVKQDWDATWRNWIRRAGNRGNYPRTRGHASTPSPVGGHSRPVGGHSKADSKALWYAQRAEELSRKYAGGDPGAY